MITLISTYVPMYISVLTLPYIYIIHSLQCTLQVSSAGVVARAVAWLLLIVTSVAAVHNSTENHLIEVIKHVIDDTIGLN